MYSLRVFGIVWLFLLVSTCLLAQVPDSIDVSTELRAPVTGAPAVDLALDMPTPRTYDPRKALLWSIIPGGGQVYNRRWWKVPLVFGGFTGMLAVLDFNQANYVRFREAYRLRLAGEPHEFSGTLIDSSERLLTFRDRFNRDRQSAYFYLIGIYLAQGVEAYVDAHLRTFDIDEDLSIRPTVVPGGLSGAPGLALGFYYKF